MAGAFNTFAVPEAKAKGELFAGWTGICELYCCIVLSCVQLWLYTGSVKVCKIYAVLSNTNIKRVRTRLIVTSSLVDRGEANFFKWEEGKESEYSNGRRTMWVRTQKPPLNVAGELYKPHEPLIRLVKHVSYDERSKHTHPYRFLFYVITS